MGYQKVYRPLFGTMPEERKHRWRLAEEFIDFWHGGLKEGDGYTDEELGRVERRLRRKLPKALREWHQLAGKRKDVWSVQDRLCPPSQIELDNETGLIIRDENQGCTRWYIRTDDLELDDPPVYGGDENRRVADSVSAFALFVLVYECQFRQIWCQVHFDPERGTRSIPRRFRRTELPHWYWFDQEVRLREAADTILLCDGANDWWYAACRTEAAYAELVADFGDRVQRN